MDKNIILNIIQEEIQKMYEETGILKTFPELKEVVLKFNRLVDEDFENVKKIYEKTFKYNISNIENIQKDKTIIDEKLKEIKTLKERLGGYAHNSPQITDEEKIEVMGMLEHVNKYLFAINSLSEVLGSMIKTYEELKENITKTRAGSAFLNDINNFKIFIN